MFLYLISARAHTPGRVTSSMNSPWCNLIFVFQADIDLSKRAGELSEEEVDKIVTIMQNPRQYKIPDWFLNRQKDIKDGK